MSSYPFETDEEFDELLNKARAGSRALGFLQTIAINLDNNGLPDDQFRNFIRNSLDYMPGVDYKKPVQSQPPESKS